MNGAQKRGTPSAWSKLKAFALSTTFLCTSAVSASAMDLKTALEITLHTNPEIAESAANRRAIDFEYEQAKRLSNPSIILEGRAGPEWVDSRTTRLLGNNEDVLWGRQASITMQQSLYDFGRNESERDRQASRVDAAAHRVWERSELVSLDVVQSYFDILRLREILNYADENVRFHKNKVSEITRSVQGGVQSEADAQQSRERLSAALVSRNETEEAMEIAESTFMRIVGRGIGRASMPASITASLPPSLDAALRQARTSNPTLHIARGDLSTARAEYRKAKADNKPSLSLEVAGRAGEDIGGFRDTTNDVRAQLVFRHEFRGGIKSSAVQEHLNWVDERRQKLLRLERSVDGLVREAWATRSKTSQRRAELSKQVEEGTRLLDSYEREFSAARRTVLDILDAQASLFQAKTALTTAEHADVYAQYRILASTGRLLEVMDLDPRREAKSNLRALEGVEDTPEADAEPRRYPKHYEKTMGESNSWSPSVADVSAIDEESLASMDIKPITKQWASKPGDAPRQPRTETIKMASAAGLRLPTEKKATDPAVKRTAQAHEILPDAVRPAIAPSIQVQQIPKGMAKKSKPASAPKPAPVLKAEPAVRSASVNEAKPTTAAPIAETKTVQVAAPKIYGDIGTTNPVPATVIVDTPVVPTPDLPQAPVLMAETISVPQEPIMGRTGADQTQAVLSDAPLFEEPTSVAEDDSLPIGVPVETVDATKFAEMKKKEDARIYWDMGAVLHNNKLYLLK